MPAPVVPASTLAAPIDDADGIVSEVRLPPMIPSPEALHAAPLLRKMLAYC